MRYFFNIEEVKYVKRPFPCINQTINHSINLQCKYQSINSSYLGMYLSINAFFGPAVASLFTCLLARYLFTYDWDWNIGMMFGSILSATDPVAVVALLRDLGQSPHITWWKRILNNSLFICGHYNTFLLPLNHWDLWRPIVVPCGVKLLLGEPNK